MVEVSSGEEEPHLPTKKEIESIFYSLPSFHRYPVRVFRSVFGVPPAGKVRMVTMLQGSKRVFAVRDIDPAQVRPVVDGLALARVGGQEWNCHYLFTGSNLEVIQVKYQSKQLWCYILEPIPVARPCDIFNCGVKVNYLRYRQWNHLLDIFGA